MINREKKLFIIFSIGGLILSGCNNTSDSINKNDDINQTQEVTREGTTEVADITSPEIICSADAIGCVIGEENDFLKYIKVTDNSGDDNVSVEVDDSKVNIDIVGEYKIIYTATDKAGNKTSLEKPCFVVMKPSSSEVMDYISQTVLDDESLIRATSYNGWDIKDKDPLAASQSYYAFQSNITSDKCYYEIFINDDKNILDTTNGTYAGLNKMIDTEVILTNTNYGNLNLDTPWMPELVIPSFLFTYNGTEVPEWDSVCFKSRKGEIIFDKNHQFKAGKSDYYDGYMSTRLVVYCFNSLDEIELFSEIINENDASAGFIKNDEILWETTLTENNKEHINNVIEIYRTLSDSDIVRNIPLREDITSIQYVNSPNISTDTDAVGNSSSGKVFPGESVTVKFKDEGITLLENDNATVKLVSMEQDILNVKVTFSVTNNRDTYFLFNLEDIYLGDTGAESVMYDGNKGPAPGKTRKYSYEINHQDDSNVYLSELCELNGVFSLSIEAQDESYIEYHDKSQFSLSDYKEEIEQTLNDYIIYN